MTHSGLRALARELPKHGRYGDSIVAHINPQEAALLKAMGGSGTINPTTGLPEYWGGLGALNPVKAISNAWGGVSKLPGLNVIDKGLVGIDKAVGSAIPGGWGTLGMAAASFVPGMTPLMMAGLGALNGSGLARGKKFNLQGALMGGAMAYGMSNLAAGLESAGGPGVDVTPTQVAADIGQNVSGGVSMAPGSQAAMLAEQASGMGTAGANNIASSAAYSAPTQTFGQSVSSGLQNLATGTGQNMAAAGRGLTNLSGLGADGSAAAARAAFGGSGATLQNTALPIVAGSMGVADAQAQQDYLDEQQNANNANAADYNSQMARINEAKARANQAVSENPYQFAMGGAVNPSDDQTGMPSQTPMQNFEQGGTMGYANGGMAGGRFLSGGGDGLSDDIPAVIGGKQPAKLADGEFVISSDVVSNLGNGSSKAGAKKLYEMMDRVRKQAHGTKKQIRKVNANRVLPA